MEFIWALFDNTCNSFLIFIIHDGCLSYIKFGAVIKISGPEFIKLEYSLKLTIKRNV